MIRKFSQKNSPPTRILILGGGFAGSNVLQELQKRSKGTNVDITLVSQDNFFLFTPLLPEISSGMLMQVILQHQYELFVRLQTFVMLKSYQWI